MKKITFISRWLFVLLLISSIGVPVSAKRVDIRHYPIGADRPRTRTQTEPVICIADKDAGYVELRFAMNVGEVCITLAASYGEIVDEISVNTTIENFAILNVPDPEESYTLTIEGELYLGDGFID